MTVSQPVVEVGLNRGRCWLATFLDRLGRSDSAATIAGFVFSPLTPTYESLASKGETMTATAMVTYVYDQIDQARAELNTVSK